MTGYKYKKIDGKIQIIFTTDSEEIARDIAKFGTECLDKELSNKLRKEKINEVG